MKLSSPNSWEFTAEDYLEVHAKRKNIQARLRRLEARQRRDEKLKQELEDYLRAARKVNEIREGVPLYRGSFLGTMIEQVPSNFAGARQARWYLNAQTKKTWILVHLTNLHQEGWGLRWSENIFWDRQFEDESDAENWAYEWVLRGIKPTAKTVAEAQLVANTKGIK